MNRTIRYLSFLCLLFTYLTSLGQNDAPAVEWKINDIPPGFPTVPIGVPLASYQPGDPLTNAISGEDWWYTVHPAKIGGVHQGYFATGFATWPDFNWDETIGGGCRVREVNTGLDLMSPRKAAESTSAKLATVGQYDKDGQMVWCKAYVYAREGAIGSTVDVHGNIIITGKTNATVDVQGNPILFNPQGASSGTNLNIGIGSGSLCDKNDSKMFVAKLSPTGALLWMHTYSAYDLSTGPSGSQAVKTQSSGIDVAIGTNGNYVVVGTQSNFGNVHFGILAVELDTITGKILNRAAYFADDHTLEPRSVTSSGSEFLISGYAEDETDIIAGTFVNSDAEVAGRGHGMIMKLNNSLAVSTGGLFGNVVRAGTSVINATTQSASLDFAWISNVYNVVSIDPAAGRTTTVFDTKALDNGKFAAALVKDCNGCRSSGANRGLGELRIYNAGGGLLHQEPLFQTGDGYLTAFDLKIGFEPSDPSEITLVTTINEGDIDDDQTYIDTMTASLDVITDNNAASLDYWNCYSGGTYYPLGGDSTLFDVTRTSALVSHHALDGTLEWEKVIDAEDGPIEVYPGDWKEQECVYQIMKGGDGELVFVGNTSHNKDDYYIAKL